MRRVCAFVLSVLLVVPVAAPAQTTPQGEALAEQPSSTVAGLSPEEITAFRDHLSSFWVVADGAEGVVVTVAFSLTPEGMVEDGAVRLVSHSDAPEAVVERAFQSARRAVLRGLAQGYGLPAEHYTQWRDMELTFDPGGLTLG